MTAEYLETSSRNLSNEVVHGSRSNSVPLVFAVFLCYLQDCRVIFLLYKS